MRSLIFGAAFLVFGAAQAVAQTAPLQLSQPTQGYTYYNRAGATAAEHSETVRQCIALALPLNSTAVQTGYGDGLIGALLSAGPEQAVTISGVENCMVVRGWRVVRLADAEGEALANLAPAELTARIEDWLGAETPHGTIVRTWNNEAADGATDRYEVRPRNTHNGALSIRALGDQRLSDRPFGQSAVNLNDRRTTRSIDPDETASAPAESTLILVHLKGLNLRSGIGLVFLRDGDSPPASRDDILNAFVPLVVNKREGNWRAYVVPPGRWRLAGIGVLPTVSFCLGSPSFEARAGEVVYAGSFDLSASNIGPDLSLEPARARLAGQSTADLVRAADYTNGWTGSCFGNAMYAIEIPGAPFREGYVGGSAPAPAQTSVEVPADPAP